MTASYDDLLETIRSRRSIRRFRPDAVGQSTIEQLLEVARWASSAGNR